MVTFMHGCAMLVVLLLSCGCGGSGQVPVAGRVLFEDGEPVQSGRIEFRSRSQSVRGTGELDAQGRFRLRTDDGTDGLPPGDYDAVVVQMVMVDKLALAEHDDHGRPLSRRYADYYTSGLEATVPPQGTTELELTVLTQQK
jgi:hypothetical protein